MYEYLRREIFAGAIAPRTVLREHEIGKACDVSRTPVREALKRLEAERWVQRDARVGLIVAAPTTEEVFESLTIAEALEGMAARLTAQRLTDLSGARLTLLHEAIVTALSEDDPGSAVHLSAEFHRVIWTSSGNSMLHSFLERLEQGTGGRMRRYGLSDADRATHVLREHETLLAAIVGRNPDAAEQAMRAHMRAGREVRIAMSLKESGFGE